MSPRIVHLPLSGRDRRHYLCGLRAAEQAHRDLPAKVEEAYRAARRLACEEWNVRQFIGGPAEPSPRMGDAIAGGRELLEVRCRRCSHESPIDLTEVVWPREKPVHTLATVLRCQACKDERKKLSPDLVALRPRHPEGDPPVAKQHVDPTRTFCRLRHHLETNADRRPDHVQLSDREQGSCGTMSVSGLGLSYQMAIYRLLRNSPLKPALHIKGRLHKNSLICTKRYWPN